MSPYVVQAITDENGNIIKSFPPVRKRSVIMPEIADVLMTMMNAVTEADGTVAWPYRPDIRYAEKPALRRKLIRTALIGIVNITGCLLGFHRRGTRSWWYWW
ncbi:MAG: hypothetical protein R2860_06980 [Desulfobacterales bacterium]